MCLACLWPSWVPQSQHRKGFEEFFFFFPRNLYTWKAAFLLELSKLMWYGIYMYLVSQPHFLE